MDTATAHEVTERLARHTLRVVREHGLSVEEASGVVFAAFAAEWPEVAAAVVRATVVS